MPADARRATRFLLGAVLWSVGLFAVLGSPWVESRLVLPLTQAQKEAADYYGGRPATPVAATLECSGADVLALCLGAILACPVSWRRRLAGATLGVALVVALNTVRIATLGHAAGSPALFETLHLQVWPAVLVLATAGYVFAWMRAAVGGPADESGEADRAGGAVSPLARRFVPWAAVLLVAFALAGPWIARSEALLTAGAWAAGAAAVVLSTAGLAAAASGNVLATSRGAFIVTPECLATALVPLYVAGVLAARLAWPARALALAGAPALFGGLAIVRLLLLALPPALAASPLFLVHGFHQLVLAVIAVVLVAAWREPAAARRWARVAGRAGVALGAAAILAVVAGPTLTSAVRAIAGTLASLAPDALAAPADGQGALDVLPAYQAALLLALGITAFAGWRRLASAFGALVVSQVALLAVVGLASQWGLAAPHALLVRAWAFAIPVALTIVMIRSAPPPAPA